MGAKKLKEYPSITKKCSWERKDVTYEQHELVHLEATGGSPYPDGEWEWSGSYNIRVNVGDIGNCYPYEGGLSGSPKYYFDKRKGRRVKRYKFDLCLKVVGGDRLSLDVGRAKNLSKLDCKRLIVHMIHEFEKTDRYKEELWPKILDPDNREPIIKDIDGKLVWIATTWKGLWSAVQQKHAYKSTGLGRSYVLPSGQYFTRQVNVKMEYPHKKEDGSTDYYRGVKIYKDPWYKQVDHSCGTSSGGGLDMNKRGTYEALIDAAIWNTDDTLLEYIMQDEYRNLSGW
ncbi:hypothetical protein SAMN02799624_05277 [Paenibacillus sp. UNC496MF]|uniref:hypothetical protein n=1 Tax=Paenibacillus sp. UNC496MF TaxID=1502753 RepID=UPI0008DFD0CB|nr:hypothetical protein [Paenibacillus sp. UNC496MF]SFJ63382.1 hypothetical protein SAMN02799624_05277 [Paenibacillus sp. UNC496MF]